MPTVPRLEFHVIGPRDYVSGAQTVQGYLQSVDRLVQNSSYWRTISLDITSSAAGAIVIAPNSTLDLAPMRVVLAGGFSSPSTHLFQDRTAGTPETFVPGAIYVGLSPSASNGYVNGSWVNGEPFGTTGSLNRWSKYWPISAPASGSSLFMVESQETVMFGLLNPGVVSNYGFYAGAIFLGYDNDSSESGRVYGMATTGNTTPATTFWTSTTTWLANVTTPNSNHAGIFNVIGGTGQNSWSLVVRQTNLTVSSNWPGELSTSNNTISGLGLHYVSSATSQAVGYLRQCYAHQDRYSVAPGLVLSGGMNSVNARIVGAYITYGSVGATTDSLLMISTGSGDV